MCGLFGIYTGQFLVKDEKELFRLLMVANYLRGIDSTGVIKYTKQKELFYDKTLLPGPIAAFDENFMSILGDNQNTETPTLLMGHTRWKTIGTNKIENAHPFKTDNFVGMHNGTIYESFEGSYDFGTDSEGLYNLIQKYGLIEALKIINKDCYDPAYALQMVEQRENEKTKIVKSKAHFIRNDQRSLWFTAIASGTTLVWSSDLNTLKWACVAMKQTPHRATWLNKAVADKMVDINGDDKTGTFFTLKPGTQMIVDLSEWVSTAIKFVKHEFPKYEYQGRQSAIPFTVRTTTKSGIGHMDTTGNNGKKTRGKPLSKTEQELAEMILKNLRSTTGTHTYPPDTDQTVLTENKRRKQRQSTKGIFQNYRGYGNRVMKKKEVIARLFDGCATCGIGVDPDDVEEIQSIKWVARDKFCCTSCQNKYSDSDLHTFAQA